jgi:6-pyruvoyltetrahydropterin/6-carboxytetrahydropterin synthase
MAHAIHGYNGACKDIHGHSYELHVSVSSLNVYKEYIPAPGLIIDFKAIKKLVKSNVIESFDHKLILSNAFLLDHPSFSSQDNLWAWNAEPTAENILFYIKQVLSEKLPEEIKLDHLKLYETKESYAEWINE